MVHLISLLGVFVFLALAWGLSNRRSLFPWRTVAWGLGLQTAVGLLILQTAWGRAAFDLARRAVNRITSFANEGAQMVFGVLANQDFRAEQWGPENAYLFIITVPAVIILVSSLSALLFHWGILQRFVQAAAWVMRRTMRVSGSESLATAANIFMGMTEAPLVIRPYLLGMTRSELMALMTGGMATVAGSVLAVYVDLGISAGHLLTASVMNAPAALIMAKILEPETGVSATADAAAASPERSATNSIDAVCRGATDGMTLAINVIAMLIAFVAVVAAANYVLTFSQGKVFGWLGLGWEPVTLQRFLGWVNAPFAWLIGVPWHDCVSIGQVLGERVILNEFIGYFSLHQLQADGVVAERSVTLATYALCGFANVASIAIQIGGIGALVPERRQDLAKLGLRSMIGGLLACYLTASLVGILTG